MSNIEPEKENILDAKPVDPVPARPWVLTEMAESGHEGLLDVRITDANGTEIIGCGMLTQENRDSIRWMDHMVKCVNICHTAELAAVEESKPQVASVNDVKRMFSGGR